MQAILFADRHGAELAPLCDSHCPALLSVANRPLIQYAIEDLASAGVTQILVVVSDDSTQVQTECGDGALWGVEIRYLLSRGEESPEQLLARFASLLKTPFLAARGDVLRGDACAALLKAAAARPGPVVSAAVDATPVGLCLVRQWPAALPDLDWPPREGSDVAVCRVHLDCSLFDPLTDLAGFHSAVLRLAAADNGGGAGGGPPGVELQPGLRVDRLAQVDRRSHESGHVLIGARSWVHQRARLVGTCVIGSDCYVDRDARVHNSIVMPQTYVGEGLGIENAIIAGHTMIRVDLGVAIAIGEAKLLSRNGAEIASRIERWPEQIIGAVALALSLPLWPIALAASTIASPRAPLARRSIVVNRRHTDNGQPADGTAKTWQFATTIPVLRHLPTLWLVARGDLRLFGARPGPVTGPRPGATHNGRRQLKAAVGLLGPSQLYLRSDAPEEEIHLWELAFDSDRRLSAVLRRLAAAARLLLSRRAWRQTPTAQRGV